MVDFIGQRVAINPAAAPIQPLPPTAALPPSGVAEVFSGLAKPFMDTLTPALKQQKLDDWQREAAGNAALSGEIEAAGREGRPLSPAAVYAAAVRAGLKGGDASDYMLGVTGNTQGYKSPLTTSALVAAGKPYHGSYQGTQDTLANARTIQQMQEATKARLAAEEPTNIVGDNGIPIITRRGDSYGKTPVVPLTQAQGAFATNAITRPGGIPALAEPEQKFIGAEPHPDRMFNWFDIHPQTGQVVGRGRSLDGKTDAATGQPLSPTAALQSPGNAGASGVFAPPGQLQGGDKRDIHSAIRNATSAEAIGGQIVGLLDRDPNLAGPVGNARRAAQDFADIATNVIQGLGGQQQYGQTVVQARNEMTQRFGQNAARMLPELFDPNLNSIQTLNGFLVYRAASALGQDGRGVSDRDIAMVKGMTGDPSSWLQGSMTYRNKVQQVVDIVKNQHATDETYLRQNNVLSPGGAPATAGTPAPAAPGAVEEWGRGADGRPVRVR